jgi:hypothetical protein
VPDRVVDVGCDIGRHAVALVRRGVLADGIGLSPTCVGRTCELAVDTRNNEQVVCGPDESVTRVDDFLDVQTREDDPLTSRVRSRIRVLDDPVETFVACSSSTFASAPRSTSSGCSNLPDSSASLPGGRCRDGGDTRGALARGPGATARGGESFSQRC